MVEGDVQLVDGAGPERIANLGAVEGDAHRALVDGAMVGDVGEVEALDGAPCRRIEQLGDHRRSIGEPEPAAVMADSTPMEEPEVLVGGVANAGTVVRIGDEVRRPAGPQTEAIQALLGHLRDRGFDGCAEPLGIDDQGRERLGFVAGDVPHPPYPAWAQSDEALASVAELLRRFHDAVAGFDPGPWSWCGDFDDPAGGAIITHNDVSLENVVFHGGVAVALLDFEFAAPGRPVFDVAQMARMCCPLDDDETAAMLGWVPADRSARLRLVADAYGLDSSGRLALAEMVVVSLGRAEDLVRNRIAEGHARFAERQQAWGGGERDARRRRWFAEHAAAFADALR